MTEQSEREAIVAWLRDEADGLNKLGQLSATDGDRDTALACRRTSAAYTHVASQIERGDHLKGKSDER